MVGVAAKWPEPTSNNRYEEAVPVFQSSSSLHFLLFRLEDLFFKEEEHSNSFKLLTPEERYQFLIDQ
jgi:hypothetical protein